MLKQVKLKLARYFLKYLPLKELRNEISKRVLNDYYQDMVVKSLELFEQEYDETL